jgi:hypothetical protein
MVLGVTGMMRSLLHDARTTLHQQIVTHCGYRQREMSLRVGYNAHTILLDSDTDVLHALAPFINDVPFNSSLCLACHCNEDKQYGDDGSLQSKAAKPSVLVHILLLFIVL